MCFIVTIWSHCNRVYLKFLSPQHLVWIVSLCWRLCWFYSLWKFQHYCFFSRWYFWFQNFLCFQSPFVPSTVVLSCCTLTFNPLFSAPCIPATSSCVFRFSTDLQSSWQHIVFHPLHAQHMVFPWRTTARWKAVWQNVQSLFQPPPPSELIPTGRIIWHFHTHTYTHWHMAKTDVCRFHMARGYTRHLYAWTWPWSRSHYIRTTCVFSHAQLQPGCQWSASVNNLA